MCFIAGVSLPVFAQKSKKQSKNNQPQTQAQTAPTPMKESNESIELKRVMHEYRMPGRMHHKMLEWGGNWREQTMVWATPEAEPVKSEAICESRVVMEGRFIMSTHRGEMNKAQYEAQSVLGWDNAKKKFIKTWFDNMGTGILTMEGTWDEAKQTIEFIGYASNPFGEAPIKVRQVLKIINPTEMLLEVYMDYNGKEYKSMEVKSTRA